MQGCLTYLGFTSVNLCIFMVNNFYCVINCLNMNRVKIYRAKYLDIVTLKVLPTSFSRYNSEDKTPKFPISKMKLSRMWVSKCKMFGGFRENDRFFKIFLSSYLGKFTHSFQTFAKIVFHSFSSTSFWRKLDGCIHKRLSYCKTKLK